MGVIKYFFAGFVVTTLISCGPDRKNDDSVKRSELPGCQEEEIHGEYLVKWKNGKISIESAKNEDNFVQEFAKPRADEIEIIEPNYEVTISYGEFNLSSKRQESLVNWGPKTVGVQSVWQNNNYGDDVVVAIIDSGMDVSHHELVDTLAVNKAEKINGIDDDGNGLVDDRYGYDFYSDTHKMTDNTGHGTHIAGIIAANHSTGSIMGIAPKAKILPLNFIGPNGKGSSVGAINSIRYAAQRKARVINASWGGDTCSLVLRDEIKSLGDQGILFVTAAGNSGRDLNARPEYPAAFSLDNQITVGASTIEDFTAGFSNYGALVDLVAPGEDIYSTFPLGFDQKDKSADGIVELDGTSMAAPFVAAAAALLWAHKPDASYSQVKKAILEGAQTGYFPVKTRGRLNIEAAIQALSNP